MPCIHGRPSVRQREGKVKDFVLIYGQRGRRRLCARPLVSRVVATRTIRSRTCFVLIHVQHARTMRIRLFSGFVVQQQITQAPSDGCTAQTGGGGDGGGTTGAWIVSSAQRARAMRRLRDGPGEGFKIVPRASNMLVLCSKTTRTALERALSWHKTGVQTSDGRWLGWPPGGALQARAGVWRASQALPGRGLMQVRGRSRAEWQASGPRWCGTRGVRHGSSHSVAAAAGGRGTALPRDAAGADARESSLREHCAVGSLYP